MSKPTLVSLIREYLDASAPRKHVWSTSECLREQEARIAFVEALAKTPLQSVIYQGKLYLRGFYGTLEPVIDLPQEAAEIDRQAREGESDTAEPDSAKPLEADLGSGALEAWGWRVKDRNPADWVSWLTELLRLGVRPFAADSINGRAVRAAFEAGSSPEAVAEVLMGPDEGDMIDTPDTGG